MDNPFIATMSLVQHTPLLHFQSYQEGATLRATELKPALDAYLFKTMGDNIPTKWRVGDQSQEALNYSLHIYASWDRDDFSKLRVEYKYSNEKRMEVYQNPDSYPQILANIGGKEHEDELKNFSFADKLQIEVFSYYPDLKEKIKEILPLYISRHTFGNRKTKGFGSFTVGGKKMDTSYFDYKFVWKSNKEGEYAQQKDLFSAIDTFYKTLRSGINYQGFYFKSLLREYVVVERTPKEQWDKKTIKDYYVDKVGATFNVDHRNSLGLSTEESWGRYHDNMKITRSSSDIDRFASPIHFKPIRTDKNSFEVYLKVNPIPDEFKNAIIEVFDHPNATPLALKPTDMKLEAFMEYVNQFTTDTLERHIYAYDRDKSTRKNPLSEHAIYTTIIKPIYQSLTAIP